MFETRCKIKDIRNARNVAEKIGGIFKGYYSNIVISPPPSGGSSSHFYNNEKDKYLCWRME